MKKLRILLGSSLLFLACSTSSFGQVSFQHSLGGAAYLYSDTYSSVFIPAIVYSPRVNLFAPSTSFSVSAGSHTALGFYVNSQDGSYFLFDLPLVAEANIGVGATPDADDGFGVFAGGGFDFNYITLGYGGLSLTGLTVNGGIRANLNDNIYEARVGYLMPFGSEYSELTAINLSIAMIL